MSLDNIGGRKFIFAILATLLAFVLVILKFASADIFFKFVAFIGSVYVIGNVASDWINGGDSKNG